jgi:hypothetical protein
MIDVGAPRGWPLGAEDPGWVGGYQLVSLLGEGGMGRVYLARSPGGRLVALKLIRVEVARREQFRRRFRSEVDRARQVPPFCTAEVLDSDPDHDPPYLVVEYVDGPDLATVVWEHGPLSAANLHGLAIGVATALVAIHGAGVIHRDLKASNVLLAPGSPKVIDFGLARLVDPPGQETSSGELVGTVAYMAPERIEPAGREVTPAADVFSWGGVVAFAGTGRLPFAADSLPAVAARILDEPPDLEDLTENLRPLVEQALAKDPADRPTARELLDRLLTTGPTAVRAPVPSADQTEVLRTGRRHAIVDPEDPGIETAAYRTPAPTLATPGGRRRRRTLVLLAAGAMLAVGLAAGLVAWPFGTAADPAGPPATTPATSAPAMEVPADLQLIVRDPLAAPGQWEPTVHEETSTCGFADGLLVTSQVASFRCKGPADLLADLAVQVDVTLLEPGSCATIWFRFTLQQGGYAVRVCEEAYYLVIHGTPESYTVSTLRRFWLAEPLVGTTRVGIVASGESLSFYRDGVQVGTWSDETFNSGRVSVGVLKMRQEVRPPYRVTFANVEIWGSAGE